MIAVGITFALFMCWSVVGYALTGSLLSRRNAFSNLLLAPVVGMCTLELAAHIGLRCESPVGPISRGIVLTSLLIAIAVLAVRRPPFPFRRLLPFGLVILAAFLLSGWPLLKWGSDWIANANGDMANYCLGATGFREHGYRALQIDKFFSGEDLTYELWSHYADRIGHRHGSEMTLAMTSEISSLPTPFVFMPVILAMHLVLISSVGYLLHRMADERSVAWLVCGFMAISPLSTFAIVQQLLAQVGGLAILGAGTLFFLEPARGLPTSGWVKRALLGGILAAGLILHYTEAVPFLAAAFCLHLAVGICRRRWDSKQFASAALSAVLVVPLLGIYLVPNAGFLLGQAEFTRQKAAIHQVIFPQFLNAEGFARLLGFVTLWEPVAPTPESSWPAHRLVILSGLCLLLTLISAFAQTWQRRSSGTMMLVMGGVAFQLFRAKTAFGLFKLAMYAQPFFLGALILGWATMRPGKVKWTGLICLLILVPLQISTQYKYVSASVNGPTEGGFTPGASKERLFTQYWHGLQTPGAKRFVVPLNDHVSRMLVGTYSQGVTVCIPSYVPKLYVSPFELEEPYHAPLEELLVLRVRDNRECAVLRTPLAQSASVPLHNTTNNESYSQIEFHSPSWIDHPQPGDYLLEPPERFTVFNRAHRSTAERMCRAVPLNEVKNYLFLQPTAMFRQSGDSQGTLSGIYGLQSDPAFPHDCMAASRQYLAFQVLNPSPSVRMVIAGTTSFIPEGRDLPPAAVVGDRRVSLPLIGQGAARVISEPVSVQTITSGHFIILELGQIAATTKQGNDLLPSDPRPISLYMRDVTLLSEEEYASRVPPECVKTFPQDLSLKHLEFSGCEETGLVSTKSWFRLTQPQSQVPLQVRGRLAGKGTSPAEQNTVIVKWNGAELGRKTIISSEFSLSFSVPPGIGPGKVELEFATARSVPPSTFKVSAQLTFVGFEP